MEANVPVNSENVPVNVLVNVPVKKSILLIKINSKVNGNSPQRLKRKIVLMATCFFVAEAINSHICFDNLRRSVVKRRGNVHLGGNGYSHLRGEDCAVGALGAGWGDKKDTGHF